ncbi:DUF296 domain-containing protein [Aurantimonas sp. A2-1-M11]|uniref:PCC domain-containing protein n=1 Tax=Aurantimonas sp. A2-1-M11 TaxID=3113712 RepID=UPI002F92E550
MTTPRRIVHPGPPAAERSSVAAARAVPLDFTVPAGEIVNAGIAQGLGTAGCDGAYVTLSGGRFSPFRYVMPAGSPGPSHAAWYSETFAPEGVVTVEAAGAIVGWREGEPFLHCHGIWSDPEGARAMGHMLPLETRTAEPLRVRGTGLVGASFIARHDAETNFTLFAAETVPGNPGGTDTASALAVTLRPNQDLGTAIAAICAERGIREARILGIGSLNGARFADGASMESYASELLLRDGRLEGGLAAPLLDISVVAMDGRIFEGRLVHGDNPVCVTFELVILPARPDPMPEPA